MPRAPSELARNPTAPPGSSARRSTASSPPRATVRGGASAKTRRGSPPPAEIVDVVDAGVDEDTPPGRPDVEPPSAWTPIAAGDQVELAELAEPAAGDESVDVTEGRHEAEVLRDHQDPARGVGHADHPVDLGKAGRDRLLHEDVQARLECRERVAQVPVVRRAHDPPPGARGAPRAPVRAEGARGAELAGQGPGARQAAAPPRSPGPRG